MPPKHLPARREDRVEMIEDPANEDGSYTSADPAYIERLQDDIKISVRTSQVYFHLFYTNQEFKWHEKTLY